MGGEIKDLGLVGATGTKGEILLKPLQGDLRLCQRRFKGFQSHRGRGISLCLPEGGCKISKGLRCLLKNGREALQGVPPGP